MTAAMKSEDSCSLEETLWQIRVLKSSNITLLAKVCIVKLCFFFFFPRSHVWMWELDQKECRALKIWCFQTVVLEKALENPFDSKEIKPVSLKGNQPWIFIGRINAEAPVLWPPDAKSWLIRNEPDLGKDWGQDKTRLIDRTGTNAWVFLKRGLNFFLLGHCGLEN